MEQLTRVQALIRNAYLTVVAEKGFQDMSVKDILENAGVSRSGFYSHYEDKYHLRTSIENEVLDQLAAAFSAVRQSSTGAPLNNKVPNAADYYALYYECLEKNEELVRLLLSPKNGDHFLLQLIDFVREQQGITREVWGARTTIAADLLEIYSAGLAWTYVGTFVAWINTDKNERPAPKRMGAAIASYFDF